MAKVRVHALAKELEIQSKDILNFLAEKNIEVKSPQSSVEDDVIALVKQKFSHNTVKKAEPAEGTKMEKTEEKVDERPKKKSSITAVFNPQNSKMGVRHPGQKERSGQRPAGQRPQGTRGDGARHAAGAQTEGTRTTVRTEGSGQAIQGHRPAGAQEHRQTSAQGQQPQRQSEVRPEEHKSVVQNQQSQAPVRSDGTRNQGGRSDGGRNQGQQARNDGGRNQSQQTRNDGNRNQGQQSRYEGGRNQGQQTRYDGNRNQSQGGRPDGNRNQGQQTRYEGNRNQSQGGRPDGNRNQGQGGRPDGNRTDGARGARPARTGNDRGGRNEGNNNRNYQNNRPGGNRPQGDKNNQRFGGNRPKEQKSRFEQEITKMNQSAPAAEEPRSKESRESRRGNNQKQEKGRDTGVKRQERYTNLEKNGGRKKRPQNQPAPAPVEKVETIKTIVLPDSLTIKELADKMKVQASVIVKKLFLQGTMVTVNQEVDFDKAEEIALEYNCICEKEIKVDVIEELLKEEEEDESKMVKRPPVVCVMGHVDHGKTSLLDAIRDTHVIDREAGGITQHIGAYMVTCNGEKITFLDTPGHEAFTAMRMRGANATDIAILVVAADDGVMPQTVEAISHAKAAGVEIIVAVNKIDKPSANIERVKQELSEYELIPEDWGGSTIFVPVSAHTHEGIDNLLEMILLTAEVAELKSNPRRLARGLVIEAQLDKGRGAVATVLVQKGTLKVGQPIAAGSSSGKVRAMIDDKGRRVKEAGPSTPVEILGLNNVPNAGEVFVSTDSEKEAKSFADTFISEGREKLLEDTKAKMSLDDLFTQIQSGNVKELGIIVKADVQGSVEAVKQSLTKLSNEEVVVKIIHGGVGAINESDVSLASASNAIIIGFNVRPDVQAKTTAEREGVDLRLYKVIYNAIEDVQAAMKGMLDPIFEEKVLGHAEVRQIFKASGIGNIAGAYILDGMFQRGCKVRITREGEQIFEGPLASLKRFKDDVKEVKAGYECGLVFEGFNDIQELDVVEAYTMVEVPR